MSPAPIAYLDHNATSPVRPEAVAALMEGLKAPLNPSSVHRLGREARCRLERARRTVAASINADPAGVVFTSGGTEANNLALLGCGEPVLVSAVEHASVLECVPTARRVPALASGVVDLEALEGLLDTVRPAVVSLMLANNETGVLQPVTAAAHLVHRFGARLHVDAAQALGRVPIDVQKWGVDLLSLSAHKMGGPAGVGALVLAPGIELSPRSVGGAQEMRRRAGTENLPGIEAWAAAIDAMAPDEPARLSELRDRLESVIRSDCPNVRIIGEDAARLPNTSCLMLPGCENAVQLMRLDLAGVAVSSGAACSSGKVGPSHVLGAMGFTDELARCAIRVSFGWSSRASDLDAFLSVYLEMARQRVPCAA